MIFRNCANSLFGASNDILLQNRILETIYGRKDSFKSLLVTSMCVSFSHSAVSNIAPLDDESKVDLSDNLCRIGWKKL